MTVVDTSTPPSRPAVLRKALRFARRNPMGAFGIGIIVIFVIDRDPGARAGHP